MLLTLAIGIVLADCSGDGSEVSQLKTALSDAITESATLAEDLRMTQQELGEAKSSIRDSRDRVVYAQDRERSVADEEVGAV